MRAYRGADIGSDHYLVLGRLKVRLSAYRNHLSQNTRDLITQRSLVKRQSPEGGLEYSRLNKLVKKSAKADDQRWADNLAKDLEEAAANGRQREVWQRIKNLSGKKKRRAVAVRDAKGQPIADIEQQRERWEEHFSTLLNPQTTSADLTQLDSIPVEPCFNSLSEEDQAPTSNEILAALSKLKNYKSPGIDGICNEQLKFGAQGLTKPLIKLFSEVWESETVPKDSLRGVITIIPKKGDISKCSNNRGITLRSTTSKLFQMVMLERLSEGLENAMRENQCGFRKNRSCVDQIFSLRAIIRQYIEYKLPLYINFVDFKSAFDCINRDFIWQAFRHYGLPDKYVRVIRAFFDGTVSAVQYNGELSRWFDVANGTGQRDIQGPPIFNVCLNWAAEMAEMHKAISRGLVLQEGTAELE